MIDFKAVFPPKHPTSTIDQTKLIQLVKLVRMKAKTEQYFDSLHISKESAEKAKKHFTQLTQGGKSNWRSSAYITRDRSVVSPEMFSTNRK